MPGSGKQVQIISYHLVIVTHYYPCTLHSVALQGGASGRTVGWVDSELGSTPSWWAATVATYCPSGMVEHPKSKSTQPRSVTR